MLYESKALAAILAKKTIMRNSALVYENNWAVIEKIEMTLMKVKEQSYMSVKWVRSCWQLVTSRCSTMYNNWLSRKRMRSYRTLLYYGSDVL